MKQTKKGFVEIPTTTLNALKNMLFSNNENGVNLSSIVNDLALNAGQRDLTAINVALAYNGVHVSIDERPRYCYEWKNQFIRYDYVGYSLLLGIVKVRKTFCELLGDGTIKDIKTQEQTEGVCLEMWNDITTNIEDILKKIEERTK